MRIAFFNPQGNFDPKDSYWTEHPDFGGQLVYVKELAIAMEKLGATVDIITRKVEDEKWPEFSSSIDYYPGVNNLRIIRIPFGGKGFLNKEQLWPHLHEYVENIIEFYDKEGTKPDFVTTHYGDGGISGVLFHQKLGTPFSFTAHSLGAQKLEKLQVNQLNFKDIEEKYHFAVRLKAEQASMAWSNINIVSTDQERKEQYTHKLYQKAADVEAVNKFSVIPPGVNVNLFSHIEKPEDVNMKEKIDAAIKRDIHEDRKELPFVLAASRLDPKKNHVGLVKAYGKDIELQKLSNLVITVRGLENPFQDYSKVNEEERKILDTIMELIKEYNLVGKVTMISINNQLELASFYRLMAKRKSVFALTALYEPFGLAPIEAMNSGLPVVVTKNGGPSEVLVEGNQRFGVLVDPENEEDIAMGLRRIMEDNAVWEEYHHLGMERVKSKYTWEATAKSYLKNIELIKNSTNSNTQNKISIPSFFEDPSIELDADWLKQLL